MTDPLIFKCSAIPDTWRIYYINERTYRVYWAQQTVHPFRKTSQTLKLDEAVRWANQDRTDLAAKPEPEADQLSLF